MAIVGEVLKRRTRDIDGLRISPPRRREPVLLLRICVWGIRLPLSGLEAVTGQELIQPRNLRS